MSLQKWLKFWPCWANFIPYVILQKWFNFCHVHTMAHAYLTGLWCLRSFCCIWNEMNFFWGGLFELRILASNDWFQPVTTIAYVLHIRAYIMNATCCVYTWAHSCTTPDKNRVLQTAHYMEKNRHSNMYLSFRVPRTTQLDCFFLVISYGW